MTAQVGPDRILKLSRAFREAKVLLSSVELSVFTALSSGGLDLESLRKKTSVAERSARDSLMLAIGTLTWNWNSSWIEAAAGVSHQPARP
jgi:hypothetical protein